MQTPNPPLILSFGMADPVGACGASADQAVWASMGCHGLVVPTGHLLSDTARIEGMEESDTDWLVDQARVLLEDMPVAAIKVGAMANVEQAAAIAEIVSDYPDLPLVFDPFLSGLPDSGLADDEMLDGLRQLLVPQTTLLMLSHVELARMAETWRDGGSDGMLGDDVAELTGAGCGFVLVTSSSASASSADRARSNTLFGPEGEAIQYLWERLPGSFTGAGGTLSAAVLARMALGDDVQQAVQAAHDYTAGALAQARRFGMGKLMPNHFYRTL